MYVHAYLRMYECVPDLGEEHAQVLGNRLEQLFLSN